MSALGNLLCPSACVSATWQFQELGVATFCRLLCSSQQYGYLTIVIVFGMSLGLALVLRFSDTQRRHCVFYTDHHKNRLERWAANRPLTLRSHALILCRPTLSPNRPACVPQLSVAQSSCRPITRRPMCVVWLKRVYKHTLSLKRLIT